MTAIPCCSLCWGTGRGLNTETFCHCPAGLALLAAANRKAAK